MPAGVVHNYFGKCVLERLKPEITALIGKDKQAYLVGAQGPDLLFYLRYEEKPLNELGTVIHNSDKIYEMFSKSSEYAKTGSDSIRAFLMGQLCHYAMDSNAHPYVYHRELDLPKFYSAGAHLYIHVVFESGLDYLYVKDVIKETPRSYKGYKNLNCSDAAKADIGKYYKDVAAPIFGMQMSEAQGVKAVTLMRRFLKICDDNTGLKYLIIRGIEKIAGKPRNASAFIRPRKYREEEDWFNHKRTPYPKYRYESEMVNYTFEEIFQNALNEAVKLIENYYECLTSGKALNKSLYYRDYTGKRL